MTDTPEQNQNRERVDEPPDADRVEDRADFPDPAFDEAADPAVEEPQAGEGTENDEPVLPPENPSQLEADEQIDPEEPDTALPPEPDEPPVEEGDDRDAATD